MAQSKENEHLDNKSQTAPEKPSIDNTNNQNRVYHPPLWSAKPSKPVTLQIIKEGVIVDQIDISDKPFYIVGRLENSVDIPMLHPSVSRAHAVLQHRNNGYLYIYDLNSTHGTFWNRRRIKPHTHVPVRSGDSISFGASSRFITLEGKGMSAPPSQEDETLRRNVPKKQKSVKKNENTHKINNNNNSDKKPERDEEQNEEEEEEEEAEAAGYGSEEEKRDMRLRIEDGTPTMADLDAVDEDDEFFDRTQPMNKYTSQKYSSTGRKRNQDNTKNNIETVDTLSSKRDQIEDEMEKLRVRIRQTKRESDIRSGLADLEREQLAEGEEEDSMDEYMRQLSATQDRETVDSLEKELDHLNEERAKLERLIKIATPSMGQQRNTETSSVEISEDMFVEEKTDQSKDNKIKSDEKSSIQSDKSVSLSKNRDEKQKDFSSEEKNQSTLESNQEPSSPNDSSSKSEFESKSSNNLEITENSSSTPSTQEKKPNFNENSEDEIKFEVPKAPATKKRVRNSAENHPRKKQKVAQWWEVDETDEEWVPPSDQTGDGRTSLNDKLGY